MSSLHILIRSKKNKNKKEEEREEEKKQKIYREQRTQTFVTLTRHHYLMVEQLNNSGLQTVSDPQIPSTKWPSHVNIKATRVRHVWGVPVAFFRNIPVIWCCIKHAAPKALNWNPARLHSLKYFPCSLIFKAPWAAGKGNQALKCTIVRDLFFFKPIYY